MMIPRLQAQEKQARTVAMAPSSANRFLGRRMLIQLGLLVLAGLAFRQQQLQMSRQASTAGQLRELQSGAEALLAHTNQSDYEHQEAMVRLQQQLQQLKDEKTALEGQLALAEAQISKVQQDAQKAQTHEEVLAEQQTLLQLQLQKLKDENEALVEQLQKGTEPRSPSSPAPLLTSNSKRHLQLHTAELREKHNYTSPACTIQINDRTDVFNRIVFLHMRKAGGTSVRDFLRDVARANQIPFYVQEGQKQVELPGDHPNTLYVTHVREPISRAISHYKYEQRWKCYEQLWNPNVTIGYHNQIMNLSQFADTEFKHRNVFFSCSQECFSRWTIACYQPTCIDPDSDLESRATQVLSQYHLVIVSEWLKDEHYSRALEAMFGNIPSINRKVTPHCFVASAEANRQFPLHPTQDDYNLLAKNNARDIRLYQHLTSCGPEGPQFQGRKIRFGPYQLAQGEEPAKANLYMPNWLKKRFEAKGKKY